MAGGSGFVVHDDYEWAWQSDAVGGATAADGAVDHGAVDDGAVLALEARQDEAEAKGEDETEADSTVDHGAVDDGAMLALEAGQYEDEAEAEGQDETEANRTVDDGAVDDGTLDDGAADEAEAEGARWHHAEGEHEVWDHDSEAEIGGLDQEDYLATHEQQVTHDCSASSSAALLNPVPRRLRPALFFV